MHRSLLLLGLLVLAAPCATSAKFDPQAAKNVLQYLSASVSVQAEGAAAQQLAAVFKDNADAFAFAGPAADAPDEWVDLSASLNNNVTVSLLAKAMDIIMLNGTMQDVSLAIHIISTYISYPNDPPELPIGSPHDCGQRLVALLFPFASDLLSGNYVKVLLGIIDTVVKGPEGPGGFLGTCQPDLPAVTLALSSMQCPPAGFLVYPTSQGKQLDKINCTPKKGTKDDETSLTALLGGALITELLLSKYPIVETDGKSNTTLGQGTRVLSWSMTRMAFAVLQSTSYADCISNLAKYEAKIPPSSAPPRPLGPLSQPITPQGVGTLCAAVAMRSWTAGTPIAEQPWDESIMVQSLVNVWLAIGKEMLDRRRVGMTPSQRFTLCATMSDVLRFKGARGSVYDMFMPDQYQCVLNSRISPCPPVGVPSFSNATWFVKLPNLKKDLGSKFFGCRWMVNSRLRDQAGR